MRFVRFQLVKPGDLGGPACYDSPSIFDFPFRVDRCVARDERLEATGAKDPDDGATKNDSPSAGDLSFIFVVEDQHSLCTNHS